MGDGLFVFLRPCLQGPAGLSDVDFVAVLAFNSVHNFCVGIFGYPIFWFFEDG